MLGTKDKEQLELLYEEVQHFHHLDYLLLEDVSNFDWDEFICQFRIRELNCGGMLCESIKLLKSTPLQDSYEIINTIGSKFKFNINFKTKEKTIDDLLPLYYFFPQDKKDIDDLKNSIEKTTRPILHLIFEDEQHNISKTGKVGNYTWSVLGGIKEALNDNFNKRNYYPEVICFQVKRGEEKRINLYKSYFGEGMLTQLAHQFTDDKSSNKFTEIYFWKTL